MTTVDDMLKDAIAGTEKEIFSEATGKDLPSTDGGLGDRSVEEMGTGLEGELEPEGERPEGETEVEAGAEEGAEGEQSGEPAAAEGGQERDPKTGQFVEAKTGEPAAVVASERPADPRAKVPLSELLTERKGRQALEKLLADEKTARATDAANAQSEFQRMNARIDQVLAGRQPNPVPVPQQNAPRKPDIFEDPDAFIADLRREIITDVRKDTVNADLARTHATEGEKFLNAYTALTTQAKSDPATAAEVRKIFISPTPGADIMRWHSRQEALRVVGDDPAAYTAKIQAEAREKLMKDPEFRKQLVAELRGEVGSGSNGERPARTVVRLPPSLNSRGGAMSQGNSGAEAVDGSDRGVFESAFK